MMQPSHLNPWILAISLLLFGPCSAAEQGRIEGLLDEGSIPVENEIHLSRIPWLDYGSDVDRHGYTAKADEKGRFAFENVPPGWYELGHMIQTSGGRNPSFTDTIRRPVQVEANQTRKILLGAEGRIVEGQFVLPEDYTDTLPFNSLGDITALYTPRPSLPID